MTKRLSNISLSDYRIFLKNIGCKCNRKKGGHEHWTRSDLPRPLTLQIHINPVPEFIIKQHLRHLNLSKIEFLELL